MKIRRKGAGLAFTAVLLSGLLATVAAPFVSASVSVGSAGTVPRGGTSSGTATFTFTENSVNCFANVVDTGALIVTILDAASVNSVSFSGTPAVVGPGTVGATASISGNVLTVAFAGASNVNVEQITVSGLAIKATTTAATGAIKANLTGTEAPCVLPGTATATGTLQNSAPSNTSVFLVNVTSTCPFVNTGTGPGPSGHYFINGTDGGAGGTATPLAVGQQTLTLAANLGAATTAGQAVTQASVPNCSSAIGSPGTIGSALQQTVTTAPTSVLPGQSSQPVANTRVAEYPLGDEISIAGTITFTITTAGVVFSGSPIAVPTGDISLGAILPVGPPQGLGTAVNCSLSVDRKSCSVTVTANQGTAGVAGAPFTTANHYCPGLSAVCGDVTLTAIAVDVDSTAVAGAKVIITATTSAPLAVSSNVVAFVGRVIVTTAAQPVVFIGKNDQQTGTISMTEQAPGFFTAGAGATNFVALCYTTGESFTRAPWAVVTAGDLKLTSGLVGVTQVAGTLFTIVLPGVGAVTCAYWQVFTASTVASTIELRGSADGSTPLGPGANNGPRINVPSNLAPGSSQAALLVGPSTSTLVAFQFVSNAIRAFQANVTVTASSQPRCLQGATDCLAGNLVVTETQNGQLKPGTIITINILPRATTQRNDVLLQATSTNQTPIATANTPASGLLVTPVGVTCVPSAILGIVVCNFAVTVVQQSFGPTLGSITFSNIHYVVAADAVNGPVNVDVTGVPVPPGNGQAFDSVVSNAIVGAAPVIQPTKTNAASAVTKTQSASAFTVSTKVVSVGSDTANPNNIVTIRLSVQPELIGKSVQVQVAIKNQSTGQWGAFHTITARVIGVGGFAYYYASSHANVWLSFRGFFAGDATHGPSTSQTVQVHWINAPTVTHH